MKIHNIEQNSPEWDSLRLGRFTASDFHVVMGNSQTRKTLIYKKAAEILTGAKCDQDSFKSVHTERGHETEEEAKTIYTLETGNSVEDVGFVEISERVGFSPDGIVGKVGGLELKCPDSHTFAMICDKDYIRPEYMTQMQFSMHYMERKWWDFACYNPRFKKPLKITRVDYDPEYGAKIEKEMQRAQTELEQIINKMK